jgi:hypothetical protein
MRKSASLLASVLVPALAPGQTTTVVVPRPPGITIPKVVIPPGPPTPCDSVTLYTASVVRNNKPDPTYYGAPTYYPKITLSLNTWTVAVPAEAYDLATPYLVRFTFKKTGPVLLDEYHPALTVLTPSQAAALFYIAGTPPQPVTCFLKVTLPPGGMTFGRQVASMTSSINGWRDVTDDWPGEVPNGGQYGMQLWYFNSAGVFTKKGDWNIKLSTCTARPGDRFRCQ